MPKRPGGNLSYNADAASRSQTFPVLTMLPDLLRKGFVVPAVVTVAAATGLSVSLSSHNLLAFMYILGCYFVFIGAVAVYALCGRPKPWWTLALIGVFTIVVLIPTPGIFDTVQVAYYHALQAIGVETDVDGGPASSLIIKFFQVFLVVGVLEEGTKILPVAALAILAVQLRPGRGGRVNGVGQWLERMQRRRFIGPAIGHLLVREPLDGILFATASAVGFQLQETLGDYLPRTAGHRVRFLMESFGNDPDFQALRSAVEQSGAANAAVLQGLVRNYVQNAGTLQAIFTTIGRTINSPFAHIAFTGCIGYAVGLAVLRPASALKVLVIGALIGIGLHAAWDAVLMQYDDNWVNETGTVCVSLLGYALFGTMILKARQISPTRALNFATVAVRPGAAPASRSAAPARSAAASSAPRPLVLCVGSRRLPLAAGSRITSAELGGGAGSTPLAEVSRNPADPRILGLRNLTSVAWPAWLPDGSQVEVAPQRNVRLLAGCRVTIDGAEARIELA